MEKMTTRQAVKATLSHHENSPPDFHRFRDLPTEIRLKIWRIACKPTFFRIKHTLKRDQTLHLVCLANGWPYEEDSYEESSLAKLSAVCSESERAIKGQFKPILEFTRPGKPQLEFPNIPYFNASQDILEVGYGFWDPYQNFLDILKKQAPESINSIQHLLVCTIPGRPRVAHRFAPDFKTLIDSFPALRTLKVLVIGDILDYHLEGYRIELDNLLGDRGLDIEMASTSSW